MSKPDLGKMGEFTYREYLAWNDSERWELINGVPYLLASPTPAHQQIVGELFFQIRTSLAEQTCNVFLAPLDLTFEQEETTSTVVQPDVFVMCGNYGQDKRIIGVPVLVIEVLSPSTAVNDFVRKLNLYQHVGVKEYWIVAPEDRVINVYLHDGNVLKWQAEYKPGDTLRPFALLNLAIDVDAVFA